MKRVLVSLLRRLIDRLKGKTTVKKLRKWGAVIGEDVELINVSCGRNDATCLEIGNHVTLTGVLILTHDASPQHFIGHIADEAESGWSSQQSFRTEDVDTNINVVDYDLDHVNVYSYSSDIYVVNNGNAVINMVQVFDLNGRIIYNGKAQENPTVINVNAANGMYVVRVITADAVRNYKVNISNR